VYSYTRGLINLPGEGVSFFCSREQCATSVKNLAVCYCSPCKWPPRYCVNRPRWREAGPKKGSATEITCKRHSRRLWVAVNVSLCQHPDTNPRWSDTVLCLNVTMKVEIISCGKREENIYEGNVISERLYIWQFHSNECPGLIWYRVVRQLRNGAIAQVQTGRPHPSWQPFIPHMTANHFPHMLTHCLLAVIALCRQSWLQLLRSAGPLYPISTGKQWHGELLSGSNMTVSLPSVHSGCRCAPLHLPISSQSSRIHQLQLISSTAPPGLDSGWVSFGFFPIPVLNRYS